MSKETRDWLAHNVLIGNTDKRGHAWHWREGDDNHYPGFIPVPEVERRLFAFDPVSLKAAFLKPVAVSAILSASHGVIKVGDGYFEVIVDDEHQAVVDPDNDIAFSYPTNDYQIHNYRQWLLENVASILDADLGISSAGLLRRRAQAWVEVSVPENIETPEGVVFRPNLLVFTSLDQSLATTYKRTIGEVVCDNTLQARIGEEGETFRVRHTAGSLSRISEARQALNIIYSAADDFSKELAELCRVDVSDRQFNQVLDLLVPVKDKEGRGLTIANNKKEKLSQLYHFDPRCAPWKGTKWGVIQTANTYNLHEATVRNTHGGGRAERSQLKIISGQAGRVDNYVAAVVDQVLATA
jgi:phage/plasmid-like protein (TIGR03299 family)